jgi:hypothetical protein
MPVETVGKDELLGTPDDLDNCRVSTILEEMFYVFDSDVQFHCNPKHLNRFTRMRLALMVLRETGYARIDAATPPRPIIIPSTKLLKLLASDHLTTDVEPLVLTSLRRLISPDEAMHHVQYLEAFTAALQNGIGVYVDVHTTILNMWGIGLLRQRRGPSGKLEWSLSKEARQAGSFEKALKICLTIHRSHCC